MHFEQGVEEEEDEKEEDEEEDDGVQNLFLRDRMGVENILLSIFILSFSNSLLLLMLLSVSIFVLLFWRLSVWERSRNTRLRFSDTGVENNVTAGVDDVGDKDDDGNDNDVRFAGIVEGGVDGDGMSKSTSTAAINDMRSSSFVEDDDEEEGCTQTQWLCWVSMRLQ